MIGKTLSHYRIVEKLGEGGMGEVYRAEDVTLGRSVAVKILPPTVAADANRSRRFLQEARAASALSHPNVCVIHEVGQTDEGIAFIVMEHVAGRTLDEVLREHALSVAEILDIGIQAADALEEAHSKGIVHRDIKPANIMITPRGQVKLLDFGLAKLLAGPGLSQATVTQAHTQEGVIMGTVRYMSPEQALGKGVDHRTDIFSIGVVLYEITAGSCPFAGGSAVEIIDRILHASPKEISRAGDHVPPELDRLIRKCMEKSRELRYQSARELLADLRDLKRQLDSGTSRPEVGRRPVHGRYRRAVYGSVALLIASGALAWYLTIFRAQRSGPERLPESQQMSRVSTGGPASANPEANEYYERGMMFLRAQFDLERARQMLEKALERDSHFAEARANHAFSYLLMIDGGYSNDSSLLYKAEEEIRQALQDNPGSVAAHSTRAAVLFYEGRKELIPAEVEIALKLYPGDLDSKIWLMNYHELNGDYPRATELAQQILRRDPLFFPGRMNLAEYLRQQGDFPGAARELEKILEQDPKSVHALSKLARVYCEQGDLTRARSTLDRVPPADLRNYQIRLARALLLALEKNRREALREMDDSLYQYAILVPFLTSLVAEFHAVLGDTPRSLEWLEKALRNGDERGEWFARVPLLASIRNEDRFKQILESIAVRRQLRTRSSGMPNR